jgi:hypothetical protein
MADGHSVLGDAEVLFAAERLSARTPSARSRSRNRTSSRWARKFMMLLPAIETHEAGRSSAQRREDGGGSDQRESRVIRRLMRRPVDDIITARSNASALSGSMSRSHPSALLA